MYDRILVGTDGSASANRAIVHALEQAELTGAQLHAIFVVDTTRLSEPAMSSAELAVDELEDWGQDQLAEVVQRGEPIDVVVETRCCHGVPHVEIIEYADGIDADIIVLGYSGHTHDKRDQLGSVTDRVVQNAGRPVLVV